MWKKLIAVIIASIIITGLSMTAFAGYDEGGGISGPTSSAAAAKSSAAASNSSTSTAAKETTPAEKNISSKSTYDDFDLTGPDAEFFESIIKVLEEGKPTESKVTIVDIVKPEKLNERVSIYGNKFDISVKTAFNDAVFSVAKLNTVTGKYERIEIDGERSIKVASNYATREFKINYGMNYLLVISYRDSERLASKVQYTVIEVEATKETADDKATAPENPVKKPNSEPLDLQTFIDNLMGKGK